MGLTTVEVRKKFLVFFFSDCQIQDHIHVKEDLHSPISLLWLCNTLFSSQNPQEIQT